ncbi:MAG TPA: hypothetical protein PLB02_05090 [Thermoanaerobaculia bacterium]|nr:hypothetical protein [Thermoanaerobaculia bacterium]
MFHFSQGYEAPHPHTRHRLAEIEEAYRQPVPKILVSAHLLRDLEGRYPGPFHVLGQVLDAAAFRRYLGENGARNMSLLLATARAAGI